VSVNIRPELKELATPINKIKPHPRNVRQGDIGAICTSLTEHGQYRPIVVQKKSRHILAGNHTYLAAKSLGWEEIAVTFVDCDDEAALRILLVDNRASSLATYDDHALGDLLQELAVTDRGLTGTGYDADDLDDLLRLLESLSANPIDPYKEWEGISDYRSEDKNSVFHTTVHFASDEDADRFFETLKRDKTGSFWWPDTDGHLGSTVKKQFVAEA
jgi:hypothetical protein